jgi:hypothetical protein
VLVCGVVVQEREGPAFALRNRRMFRKPPRPRADEAALEVRENAVDVEDDVHVFNLSGWQMAVWKEW